MSLIETGFAVSDGLWLRAFTSWDLEDELHRHLNNSRREGAADRSEGTVARGGIRRLEIRLVHQVEKFGAEFQFTNFRPEREVLVQTKIGLVDCVTAHRVAAGVAERVGVQRVHRNND